MRYYGLLLFCAIFLSLPVSAESTPEERCEKQGDVAEKAANLRISGSDKETATKTLTEVYDHPGSGVTVKDIEGMVMVSYMAKMKPDQMRNYIIAECKKDILK